MNTLVTPSGRLLLLATLLAVASACTRESSAPPSGGETAKPTASAAPAAPAPSAKKTIAELTLRELKIIRDANGQLIAQGTVDNTASRVLKHVEATLKIFDEKGAEIGTLKPMVDQLQPLYSWTFNIPVPHANASKATLVEFTGE
ncbi:MAG TPA: FxLYD domain-containing protein [Accumulibacter sp.]|nr:FxLYD domain-containing protein [Accumulibacter sp.]